MNFGWAAPRRRGTLVAMSDRPSVYPAPAIEPSLLDVLTSPVPSGRFDSPVDHRHVLCLHVGAPVPVSYRAPRVERQGVRLHGQFCVVPAGSSTRWTLTRPATSLLLRLEPGLVRELAPSIHIRDPHVERIGWMMQAEEHEGHPGGRLFADGLATALAARLLALQGGRAEAPAAGRALAPWRLRRVVEYIEAHLDADLTLGELAAVAGYSVSHFKPLFRQAAGMPAHRFVLERRVARAQQLILEGRRGMLQIALETGFAHPSHMARSMQRVLGVRPSQLAARRPDRA